VPAGVPAYGGAYLDKIVVLLESAGKESAGADASWTEQVSKQADALRRLKAAMVARGWADAVEPLSESEESGSTEGRGTSFDAGVDDDEVLLRLLRELDSDGDGTISMKELLEAPLLKKQENAEMARVLWRAVGCDLQALGEALAPLADAELAAYAEPEASGEGEGPTAVDRTAMVKAVFEAIGPSWQAVAQPDPYQGAGGAGERGRRLATRADLERFLGAARAPAQGSALATALARVAATLPEDEQLDFLALKEAARKVPLVAAQRLEWVRSMGFDAALARHLPPGTLDDG
jgi:hypothetical protein